jgi:hypothetical protein
MTANKIAPGLLLGDVRTKRDLRGKKKVGRVHCALSLHAALVDWVKIMAKRTGLHNYQILEYALLTAVHQTKGTLFIDYIKSHKFREIRKGRGYEPGESHFEVRAYDQMCSHLYDLDENAVRAEWEDAFNYRGINDA